jgi:hypothetical protein
MGKRVSIAVCLTLGVSFALAVGCSSIPDSRKILPAGYEAGTGEGGADSGTGTGNKSGSGGRTGAGGGAAGRAAAGGGSGKGGSGGTVVTGAGGVPEDGGLPGRTCGTAVCHDRHVGGTSLAACCAGKNGDKCGFETAALGTTTCVAVNQPGNLDSGCSDQTPGNITFKGCCRPNATCGLLIEPPGGPHFGCVDPTEVGVSTTTSCTPPVCKAAGSACTDSKNCCAGGAGLPVCNILGAATSSTCTEYCVTNGDCPSGCCVPLISGRGACADKSECSTQCRPEDETCDADGDCCTGFLCSPNSDIGPRLCRPACSTNTDCGAAFCVKDAGGRGTCSTYGAGLCTDTCRDAKDGSCDDGGPGSAYASCALGTDCTDCAIVTKTNGVRLGGTAKCSDACATSKNGKCEDGGTGSFGYTCAFGGDCSDCGPRLGICANYCSTANDGECDDGGSDAAYGSCAFGTDCVDCGARFGGRGQTPCDGTHGTACTSSGGRLSDGVVNDVCDCADCAWDSGPHDCNANASMCDGIKISACCAPGNPCSFDGDGLCDCGGWCEWEKKDCGPGATGPRCDGASLPSYAAYCDFAKPVAADGYCDCKGACSWEAADCIASLGTNCADTCQAGANYIHNGICEDGGLNATSNICTRGTDCADCGPR